jgi:phosphate transport system ATP-binding protein
MKDMAKSPVKIQTHALSFSYDGKPVLRDTTACFREKSITAIIGPSGSGKSTFLMTLNRLWEEIPNCSMQGTVEIHFDGKFRNIYGKDFAGDSLRRRVGMVFQVPNPLPMGIFRNIAFPLHLAGIRDKDLIRSKVERMLKTVRLWDEVKDRLSDSALSLSGGQQQRMCIARAMILEPEVLLLDEPTSSLDGAAAEAIEQLLVNLKKDCTMLVVSHYLDQVKRIADGIVELREGRIVAGR